VGDTGDIENCPRGVNSHLSVSVHLSILEVKDIAGQGRDEARAYLF